MEEAAMGNELRNDSDPFGHAEQVEALYGGSGNDMAWGAGRDWFTKCRRWRAGEEAECAGSNGQWRTAA